MSKFEVHIPEGPATGSTAVTLRVDADNWMAALKAGTAKLGEQGAMVQNVLVDIQENGEVHVTESRSGRVFRIRELTEDDVKKGVVKKRPVLDQTLLSADGSQAAKTLIEPPKEGDPSTAITDLPGPATVRLEPVLGNLPKRKGAERIEPRTVEELVEPTRADAGPIGRQRPVNARRITVEDMLVDIFVRVEDVKTKKTIEEAAEFALDLALEKIPCDAASVLHADGLTGDLTFIAARGPKSKQLLKGDIVIPAGQGIAGFCVVEGVSVGVSDVEKDPRFYSGVADKVDYETKSLACSPMMAQGRAFGCVQLINRKAGPQFAEHEVGLVSYLAHQLALFMNDQS